MKKIYINELETERRNELIKKNSKLIELLQHDLYENNMELQYIEGNDIISDEAYKAIEYHNHYSSFFYTLKDWRKFYQNIDYAYLSDEASRKADKITKNIDKIDALPEYNDEYYKLDEECEELAKEILQEIEDILHSYEEYPTEDEAIEYADEMEQLEEYYIEEREDGTTDGVIRKDISYTECYIWKGGYLWKTMIF